MHTYTQVSDTTAQHILGPVFDRAKWMAAGSAIRLKLGKPPQIIFYKRDGAQAVRTKSAGPTHKAFKFQLKEATSDGTISGFASVTGNLDLDGEIIDRGAFTKTIQDSHGIVPILWGHNRNQPCGWGTGAEENDHGLAVRGKLMVDTDLGKYAHSFCKSALAAGGKPGLSIGFQVPTGGSYTGDGGVTHFRAIDLKEWSIVTFAANPEASVTAAKEMRVVKEERCCAGFFKHTNPNEVWVHVNQSEDDLLHTVAHEVFHAAKSRLMSGEEILKHHKPGMPAYEEEERHADFFADLMMQAAPGTSTKSDGMWGRLPEPIGRPNQLDQIKDSLCDLQRLLQAA